MTEIPPSLAERMVALEREIGSKEMMIAATKTNLQQMAEEMLRQEAAIAPLQREIEVAQAELRIIKETNETWLAKIAAPPQPTNGELPERRPPGRQPLLLDRIINTLAQGEMTAREVRAKVGGDHSQGSISGCLTYLAVRKGKLRHNPDTQKYSLR